MKSAFSVLLLCFLLASCGEEKTVETEEAVESEEAVETEKTIQERAEAGDAEAQCELSKMYYEGEEVPKDDVKAVKWMRKAAGQGYAIAQAYLGGMYLYGPIVPKDVTVALKWYHKAAEQGERFALFQLGNLYFSGEDEEREIPKDYAKAYMFYNLHTPKFETENPTLLSIFKDIKAEMTEEQIAEGQKLTREWLERKAKEKGE